MKDCILEKMASAGVPKRVTYPPDGGIPKMKISEMEVEDQTANIFGGCATGRFSAKVPQIANAPKSGVK